MKKHKDGSKIKPDQKCAPSKKYTDGSCFSLDTLKKIVNNYNDKNNDKIDITLDKEELVKELESKLSNQCNEQTCWLRLDIVKELENDDIQNNTFRPTGPKQKYEWLSTTHINDVIEQYQEKYNDFIFLGAVPYDFEDLPVLGINKIDFSELEKNKKTKIGMVINLDEHYKNGSHWVALYTNLSDDQIYFFDSLGKKPQKRIRKFINRITKYLYNKKYNTKLNINDTLSNIKKYKNLKGNELEKAIYNNKYIKNLLTGGFDIRYNHIQHQLDNSECGVYSINFIINLVEGKTFEDIIKNVVRDDDMNENRKLFFRNVN